MQVLVHLGLNKCASTYLQHALSASRAALLRAGVFYPAAGGRHCDYGVSRQYGFGPDAAEIPCQPVAPVIARARALGAERVILSSEYFSLHRPAAAGRLVNDLSAAECRVRYILFSRPVIGWIRSLYNQYLRTVDDGRPPADIDAFVDQVLANGAIDIRRRYEMWRGLAGSANIEHFRIADPTPGAKVLAPFAQFAGVEIPVPGQAEANPSIPPGALYRIARLRAEAPAPARDALIRRLIAGELAAPPAPAGFLVIGKERMARLKEQVIEPYEAIPSAPLAGIVQSA